MTELSPFKVHQSPIINKIEQTHLSCELSLDISGVEVGVCWTGFWRSRDARRRVFATVDLNAVEATTAWNLAFASCQNKAVPHHVQVSL